MLPIFLALLLCFCQTAIAQGDAPTTATRRIISLAPNLTEMIHALGHGEEIVGATDFCLWPEAAKSHTKVGGLYNLNIEQVIALRPTLIVYSAEANNNVARLRDAGYTFLFVKSDSLPDIFKGIETLGVALDESPRAARLNAKIRTELDAIAASVANKPRPTVLYVIGHAPGELRQIYSVGPGTFLDEILSIAGGNNAMAKAVAEYPIVSREEMIVRPPDVILTSSSNKAEGMRKLWLDYLGRDETNGPRVVFLDDKHLMIPGPSVAQNARKLAAVLHENKATTTP